VVDQHQAAKEVFDGLDQVARGFQRLDHREQSVGVFQVVGLAYGNRRDAERRAPVLRDLLTAMGNSAVNRRGPVSGA
jgi:hypothetical protein